MTIRRSLAVLLSAALIAAGCTNGTGTTIDSGTDSSASTVADAAALRPEPIAVGERAAGTAPSATAGAAVTGFGNDLFSSARADAPTDNLTISPLSIAVAFAMLEPGADDSARDELASMLHVEDRDRFHASMNTLEQELENRVLRDFGEDSDPGELTIRLANAAYVQRAYPILADYLNTIGRNYGPALNEVDYRSDPNAVADEINDWVAEQTEDRIVDLVPHDTLAEDHVLALVNALYLNASWFEPFETASERSFTRLDGEEVEVPLMPGYGDSSSSGDGWIGATKSLAGDLYVQFILPDEGRFEELASSATEVFEAYPERSSSGASLVIPKFETRSSLPLDSTLLEQLGVERIFEPSNLNRIAGDPTLRVNTALHATFLAMDEEGIEAAAATVIFGIAMSGPEFEPVPVVLDRPFLYRIVDNQSGATLFLGQITDPIA